MRFDGPQGIAVPLEEVLIRHSLGEDIRAWTPSRDASGVMMIPIPRRGVYRGVQRCERAAAREGIDDIRITAKTDEFLIPLPEGRSYLGFIFASGKDPAVWSRRCAMRTPCSTFEIEREIERGAPRSYFACCGTNPGGSAAPAPKKKSSMCRAINSCASFCHGIRRY